MPPQKNYGAEACPDAIARAGLAFFSFSFLGFLAGLAEASTDAIADVDPDADAADAMGAIADADADRAGAGAETRW